MRSRMKRGTPEYRAFHAAEMRAWRAKFTGPRRPKSCQASRGVEMSTALCEWCLNEFTRTNQPRLQRFCCVTCRSAAKRQREKEASALDHVRKNPPKPKPTKEPVKPSCFGCKWRSSLFCGHPGLDVADHTRGSVSLVNSGKCPLTNQGGYVYSRGQE